MRRIEGANYITVNGKRQYTDGPPGTDITAKWLNGVQEEIFSVIENKGRYGETNSPTDTNLLLLAIRAMIKASAGNATSVYEDPDSTGAYGDLSQAVADAVGEGTSEQYILLDCNVTLTKNLAIPSYISLVVQPGVTLTYGAYSLTIDGKIYAAPDIVWLSGSGTLDFNDQIVFVDWWGVDEDAFDFAFEASRHVRMPENASYTITKLANTISVDGSTLIGLGSAASTAKITTTLTAGNIFEVSASNCVFRNFEVYGAGVGGTDRMFHVDGFDNAFEDIKISNAYVAIQDQGTRNSFDKLNISNVEAGIYFKDDVGDEVAYVSNSFIAIHATSATACILIIERGVISLTNCFLSGSWATPNGGAYGVWVRDIGGGVTPYCKSLVLTGCTLAGFGTSAIRTEGVGTNSATLERRVANTVINGGRIQFEAKAYTNLFILTNKDAITFNGVAIHFPNTSGGGSWTNFINDANCDTDARVTINNTLIKTKTSFTSSGKAKVVDLTEVSTDELGVFRPTQAVKEVLVDLGNATGGPYTPDLDAGNTFLITYTGTGAVTVANASNLADGTKFTMLFDRTALAVNPCTIAWGANYKFVGGSSLGTMTVAACRESISFVVEGTDFIEQHRSLNIQ